jgi:hypothetical protein
MLLWEYLWMADRRRNLALPEAGKQWLLARPWAVKGGMGWWTQTAQENWTNNILALRSLAARLKGKNRKPHENRRNDYPAQTFLEERTHDRVLSRYVGMLRAAVVADQTGELKGLTLKTYHGVQLFPSVTDASGERSPEESHPAHFWQDDLDFFWQVVFLSFVEDRGPVVCARCGKPLAPFTPTGRVKKQKHCTSCRVRAHRAARTKLKIREINKQHQAEKRKFDRTTHQHQEKRP